MIEKQPDEPTGATPRKDAEGANQSLERENMPYRLVADEAVSFLPADDSVQVGICRIETIKDPLDPTASHTIAIRNIDGNRYQLEIRYRESEDVGGTLEASLQINGRDSKFTSPSLISGLQFPLSIQEQDLIASDVGLKGVVHESLFEFRVGGPHAVLDYLQSVCKFDVKQISIDLTDSNQAPDRTKVNCSSENRERCVHNLRALSEHVFNQLAVTSHLPEVSELPALSNNIKVRFQYPEGPALVLNLLPLNLTVGSPEQVVVQEACILLPSAGFMSKFLFARVQEQHYLDIRWKPQSIDTENGGQIESLLNSYRDLVGDYLGGSVGKVGGYFSAMEGFHAVLPLSNFSRIADWYRSSRAT